MGKLAVGKDGHGARHLDPEPVARYAPPDPFCIAVLPVISSRDKIVVLLASSRAHS
jgi:hypothetical protein